MLSVMLEDHGNYAEMFMYVFAGAVAIAMFRDLKENSEIGFPTFISIVMQAVLLVAFNVLFQNRTLGISLFILPALNLMINLLILLIFLNMFGVYIIRKSKDMYMEINDAEFSLLQALKLKDKDEYFRAIHTAYLAERIALGLGFDPRSVKTCSYYHRIGVIDGKMNWDDVSHYYIENNFPDEAIEFLHEYMVHKKGELRSKEAITVSMSEAVISSIMDLLKQNSEAIIDYDKLIDELFDSKFNSGEIAEYAIYLSEFLKMKKILKKEKLYYGFLRR